MGDCNSILLPRDQAVRTVATLNPSKSFLTSFIYNNWGYELVGQILKIAGKSISDLLHEKLFKPLGMGRTSTAWDFDEDNNAKSYGVLEDLSQFRFLVHELVKEQSWKLLEVSRPR
jgi:CubicO group peptidase (beta-lactamase class C family)